MADRLIEVQVSRPVEGVDSPQRAGRLPVEGRRPAVPAAREPAIRQPELGPNVASVVDEREVLSIRDGSVGECEGIHVLAVPRRLVVECEGIPRMADRAYGRGKRTPSRGRDLADPSLDMPLLAIGGTERISGEGVLEVGEDELLVLLLVMQPEDERIPDPGDRGLVRPFEEVGDAPVDLRAIMARLRSPSAARAGRGGRVRSARPRHCNRS